MTKVHYEDLRRKIGLVFDSYLYISMTELAESGVKVDYKLEPSFCRFTAIFKNEYFVWVEKFYEHLDGWGDFEQRYSYEAENYVTFDLVSKKNQPLPKYFFDKKEVYFIDILSKYGPGS